MRDDERRKLENQLMVMPIFVRPGFQLRVITGVVRGNWKDLTLDYPVFGLALILRVKTPNLILY